MFFRNFWKISENFLKNFWNISEKFMNPEIFCCQRFKNEWKLAVLLLFSKFSASFSYFWQFPGTKGGGKLAVLLLFSNFVRCVSRILTNFRNFSEFFQFFSEFFQNFLRNFWKKTEKILKKIWNISEKIMNPEIFCCQRFKNEWKLAVLLLFSKFSASFSYFWQFPGTKSGGKLAVLLLFSNFVRCFSRILTNFRIFSEISEFFQKFLKKILKFLKKFWKISEIFLKNLWIQRFSAANHPKMKETSCFAAVFKVFS